MTRATRIAPRRPGGDEAHGVLGGRAMKKLLPFLTLVGLLVLALGTVASAGSPRLTALATSGSGASATAVWPVWAAPADPVAPTVSGISPAAAPNDIDAPVTITGSGFAAVLDGTGNVVLTAPTVTLGGTPLTGVTFVDSSTLTATVPWGMDRGACDLTVVNPDGGSGSLTGAFTVTQGLGQWNGGELYGGDVRQLLMKPGDPSTLYAPAYGLVGLFRSTDAGASWTHVGVSFSLGNYKLAVDPHHADWLWAYTYRGVECSKDEGETWTLVMDGTWPDGSQIGHGRVYPSPTAANVLFVSSYYEPLEQASGDAQGLIRSSDGGGTWKIVNDLDGVSVEDVAFEPGSASEMVLVTRDAHVFHSTDAGRTWSQVASPPVTNVGFNETLAYNPNHPGEVWIDSMVPDKVFKSTDATLSDWQDVTPSYSLNAGITFAAPDSVYLAHWSSNDDGAAADWQPFGPLTGNTAPLFVSGSSPVGYVGDGTYGVQKTTDGGQSWAGADNGLTGMTCSSMDVSAGDPLRVYATFGNWPGVYRSGDGAGTWSYVQALSSGYAGMTVVRGDPTDPDRVYAVSHTNVYRSTDGGDTWLDLGWNAPTPAPDDAVLWVMAADPFQAGHVMVALDTGAYLTGPGYLYASSDYGAQWQELTLPQPVARITDIAFDQGTPGLVYAATGGAANTTPGTGLYRSSDYGVSWTRIDDQQKPGMRSAQTIAIATHPRQVLFVMCQNQAYRSLDGGATWQRVQTSPGNQYLFAGGDSTRLYAADSSGLYFSSDAGDTWTRAAGALGRLQILALGSAAAERPHDPLCRHVRWCRGRHPEHVRQVTPHSAHREQQVGGRRHLPLRAPAGAQTDAQARWSQEWRPQARPHPHGERPGDTGPLRRQQGQADRATEERRKMGHAHARDTHEQRNRRVQLEVQAPTARQLPPACRGRQDDQDRRGHDDVARLHGEVASRRRGRQGGRVRSDSSASAHPDRPVRASTTFPVHRRR